MDTWVNNSIIFLLIGIYFFFDFYIAGIIIDYSNYKYDLFTNLKYILFSLLY